jgi:hypothetical protein
MADESRFAYVVEFVRLQPAPAVLPAFPQLHSGLFCSSFFGLHFLLPYCYTLPFFSFLSNIHTHGAFGSEKRVMWIVRSEKRVWVNGDEDEDEDEDEEVDACNDPQAWGIMPPWEHAGFGPTPSLDIYAVGKSMHLALLFPWKRERHKQCLRPADAKWLYDMFPTLFLFHFWLSAWLFSLHPPCHLKKKPAKDGVLDVAFT